MNPTKQPEALPPGKWDRLAWLPIPLLLVAIIVARMAGLRESYESHALLLVLSFTFYTLVSLGTLYLIGRSFLASGSPGLLLLECGVVLWSLAGTVGDFVSHGDANINVTIFNNCILLAGLCHLAGAILALRPQRVLRRKPLWLCVGCAFTMGALWLVSQAARSGWFPVFFIPGYGGTIVRYFVLISAISMFVLSAGVLHANQRAARLPFTSWYALALLLLAVGLFGIMIQLSLGSVVNWLSRTAQWLGGIYLLFAALASQRESQLPLLPPEKKSHPAYYRDAVAVSVVLAAAAIRLAFLSAMGTKAPYLVFFPAVMIASIYGGLRAGLLATALSAILALYFWIEPTNQFSVGEPSDWLTLVIFLLSGAMIAWVTDSMHRARARAAAAETQALLAAERLAAAEALQAGRAKLEAALASMTDAVFISDTQGRFIDFNDAFATFHKFRNKEECSKAFAEYPDILDVFMDGETLVPLDMRAVPRALRGETVTNAEYTLRRKDTGETWVGSYTFGPIRAKDGAIVGSVVVGRDITKRRQMEEELRRSRDELELRVQKRTADLNTALEKLELRNKELQDFAFVASHDMREPLRKIQTFGGMVLDHSGSNLSDRGKDYLARMQNAANRMDQLLTSLLGYSRISTRGNPFSPTNLTDLARDAVSDLKIYIEEKGASVKYGDLPIVEADPPQIRQLFGNLIHNGIKFNASPHPEISIRGETYGVLCRIFVQDNGIGFNEQYLGKIFSPFQRLHGRSEYEGMGMGLAICAKIVERHGGSITARSNPGEGSTFIVTLPLRQPSPTPASMSPLFTQ